MIRRLGKKGTYELLQSVKDDNPYPLDIFIEKTPDQWRQFHKALEAIGLKADGFMGSHAREVWNHAVEAVQKKIKESWDE